MERLRLKEAFAYAQDCGIKINRTEVAEKLWPDSSVSTRRSNLCNLESGVTTRVKVDWVVWLTHYCDCTADMLFGLEPFPNIKNKLD